VTGDVYCKAWENKNCVPINPINPPIKIIGKSFLSTFSFDKNRPINQKLY
jgi:hypothetical protein